MCVGALVYACVRGVVCGVWCGVCGSCVRVYVYLSCVRVCAVCVFACLRVSVCACMRVFDCVFVVVCV